MIVTQKPLTIAVFKAACAFTVIVIDLGDLQDSRTWVLKLKSGTVANPKWPTVGSSQGYMHLILGKKRQSPPYNDRKLSHSSWRDGSSSNVCFSEAALKLVSSVSPHPLQELELAQNTQALSVRNAWCILLQFHLLVHALCALHVKFVTWFYIADAYSCWFGGLT